MIIRKLGIRQALRQWRRRYECRLQCFKEMGEEIEPKVARCSGGAECKKALLLMKVGKLPEDFIEGMVCAGGCVGGPSKA